jgi:hypothetical protein
MARVLERGEAGAPCCHQGNRPGPHGALTTDVVQLGADFGRVFSSDHWRLPQSGRWSGSRKIGREGAVALSQKAFESRMNTGSLRVFQRSVGNLCAYKDAILRRLGFGVEICDYLYDVR